MGSARLLVATCTLDNYPDIPTLDPIRSLRSQSRSLVNEKDALEKEMSVLNKFGKEMADIPELTPENANSFSDTLFEKIISNSAAIQELDEKITLLDRKISRLEDARAGKANVKAAITIVADEAGPAQLKLTYRES